MVEANPPEAEASDDYDESSEEKQEMSQEEKNKNLLNYVKAGDVPNATAMIQAGADPCYEENGWNPLLWAACNGNEDLVRLLIRNNAHLMYKEQEEVTQETADANEDDQVDNFKKVPDPAKTGKYTPLHWASYQGHYKVVWILMKENMSPLIKDKHGNNCIH